MDDYIFKPIGSGYTGLLESSATLVSIGDNYTVASLSLLNIDGLTSTVNLYYDDDGWIVSYLPNDAPAAQIWQARGEDLENPDFDAISATTLLDAINVVVAESLSESKIAQDTAGLGYYHWQYSTANSFLMMAVSRATKGDYPVQFAVPDTLTLAEVSATLWVSQGANPQAPCARVQVDGSDLIASQCTKGIYSSSLDLTKFGDKEAHTWKLEQTERDEGASGALLMIVYTTP